MPSIWRAWSQGRPPRPFVEDEFESLSHELGGLLLLGEKPGVEGACERGSIDQLPIFLDIERSAIVDTDTSSSQPPSLTSQSSAESFALDTPPPLEVMPIDYRANDKLRDPLVAPINVRFPDTSSSNPLYNSNAPVNKPQRKNTIMKSRERNPCDHQRVETFYHDYRQGQAKATSSLRHSVPYNLETATYSNLPKKEIPRYSESPKRPTVAELLEEKLRLRREQQVPKSYVNTRFQEKSPPRNASESSFRPGMKLNLDSLSVLQPKSREISTGLVHPMVEYLPQSNQSTSFYGSTLLNPSPEFERKNLSFNTGTTQTRDITSPTTPLAQDSARLQRRIPSPEEAANTALNRQRRGVSFADDPHIFHKAPSVAESFYRQNSDAPQARSIRPVSPPKQASTRNPELPSFALRPCPRANPVAGCQDWYTVSGLTHLKICPGCMNQIGGSRFRDYFVPSLSNPREKVHCSFSEPWTRLAWIQTMKKGHENLDMLYDITHPSNEQCPGRRLSAKNWYRIVDHQTGLNVPRFAACSACVRNLQLLMPSLRQSFRCQAAVKENICDFAVESPRFVQYLDLLDAAASNCEYKRTYSPDIDKFIDYVERKCNLRDCRRDRLILGTWHYIPDLPEFTVCEDCYDDVVRPLVAAHKPIARMMANPPRLLPGSGPSRCREASCQLYSPRMRARFRDAVLDDDYRMLESAALRRFDAERRFRDQEEAHFLVAEADRDCTWQDEWRRAREEWKRF
ncbi:hypothetical protein BGW36DRAFT_367704, partial [Talaromyces proteolyticus]